MSRDESPTPIWVEPEPGKRKPGHTRDAIAAAAVTIADREGIGALSMRRVAAELGAGTMTLYHYVRTKDDLLSLMDNAIMGELVLDDAELAAADWRAALTMIAKTSKATYDRHPWMVDGLKGGNFGPNGMRHFEQSLIAVATLELEPVDRLHVMALIDEFVLGFVARDAQDVAEVKDEGFLDRAADYIVEMLATGDYPHAASLMTFGDDPHAQIKDFFTTINAVERFDSGLEILLDGIAVFLRERGAL